MQLGGKEGCPVVPCAIVSCRVFGRAGLALCVWSPHVYGVVLCCVVFQRPAALSSSVPMQPMGLVAWWCLMAAVPCLVMWPR